VAYKDTKETKQMNGQVYHLCIKLTLHKAEDFRLEKKGEQQKEDKTQ